MPTLDRSDKYFDGWYADQEATPIVAEIMNRHMGLPQHLEAGVVAVEAIEEIAVELRLSPGDLLVDLACGRGGVSLQIAARTGARLVGVDFSAEAVRQAREQARRLGSRDAEFKVGDLTSSGLAAACADAVMCTDAMQFPDRPEDAYAEVRRLVKTGGRVALTGWEPVNRHDETVGSKRQKADYGASLKAVGFTDVEVHDRPVWRARERAMWEEAVSLEPGDDPALQSFHGEAVKVLETFSLSRRILATATAPLTSPGGRINASHPA
jgi:SAM-dependent methyltransferase